MFRRSICFLSAMLWLVSYNALTAAQSATVTLSGFVADENGGYIPNTEIEVLNNATALLRKTKTNGEGYFTVPLLPPGNYSLTARSDGFAVIHHPSITLNVNDSLTTLIRMKPGSINDTITITGEPLLLKNSPVVGTVVDRQFAENLPLNGRSFQSLINITPGVVLTETGDNPGHLSVNAQRPNANYFTVDGVSANFGVDPGSNNYTNGSLPALSILRGSNNLVSEDALEEFRIQGSTYAPEFGRMPGGQISIITRSGTNQFHGKLFNYLRNDVLDANDWFANQQGLARPPLRQNDFGGVLGGPVLKDRAFFFFSYEGLQLRQPLFQAIMVPSASLREKASEPLRNILNLFPRPNGPEFTDSKGLPIGLAPFSASYSDPSSLNATSLRLDHKLNKWMSVSGRYNHAPSESSNRGATSLSEVITRRIQTETLTGSAIISVKPGLDNEFRLNWSRQSLVWTSNVDEFGGAKPVSDSAIFPSFASSANSRFLFQIGFPSPALSIGRARSNALSQINLVNNLSYVTGKHKWKFGVDYRHLPSSVTKPDYLLAYIAPDPALIADGLAFVGEVGNDGPFFPYFTNLSLFTQDNWQITPRLTMTYGMRWEYNPPPSEKNGRYLYSATDYNDPIRIKVDRTSYPYWKATFGNFAPRYGLAYQFSQGKWARVIRGGFGVYYDLGTDHTNGNYDTSPFVTIRLSPGFVPIPVDLTALQPLVFPGDRPPDVYVYEDHHKLPYTLQWNLTLEQSLGEQQTVTTSYVGSVGRRLVWVQGNYLAPVNPDIGSVIINRNASTSDYHALQIQYQRRLSNGLQALTSYVWSHSIDNNSKSRFTPDLGPFPPYVGQSNIALERGSSGFDVRHSFVASLTYDIPTLKSDGFFKTMLKDWSLASIIRLRTGTPISVFTDFTNARPDVVPGEPFFVNDPNVGGGRRLNPDAFAFQTEARQGTLGRNVIRNFGLSQTDLALHRQFKLTEGIKLQLRAEFFNLFNHPNFALTFNNTVLTNPLFGRATNMLWRGLGDFALNPLYQVGGPRSTQLALKLIF